MPIAWNSSVKVPNGFISLTCLPGGRLLTTSPDDSVLLDANGKQLAKLPRVAHVDPTGVRAVVEHEGADVKGKWTWKMEWWDLAKAKKLAPLSTNTPANAISSIVFGPRHAFGLRTSAKSSALVRFDVRGTIDAEWKVAASPAVFHLAVAADERTLAHVYFTGKGGLVDTTTGKESELIGGALRIGRQHERGVSQLGFGPGGDVIHACSSGTGRAWLWQTATRKVVKGPWSKVAAKSAFFAGDRFCVFDGAALHVFGVDGSVGAVLPFPAQSSIAAFEGTRIVRVAVDQRGSEAPSPGVEIWDVAKGKKVASSKRPKGLTKVLRWSTAHGAIALGDLEGNAVVGDVS